MGISPVSARREPARENRRLIGYFCGCLAGIRSQGKTSGIIIFFLHNILNSFVTSVGRNPLIKVKALLSEKGEGHVHG
jgi:hypothetical protein